MDSLVTLLVMAGIGVIIGLVKKRWAAAQGQRDQELIMNPSEPQESEFANLPIWLVLTLALVLPALAVLQMILNPGIRLIGGSVFLNFSITVALGILFTYYAKKRQGWTIPDRLMIALWVSPALYVVVPMALSSFFSNISASKGSELWGQEVGAGLGAFILVPSTYFVVSLTQRRYSRVKWLIAQAEKAKAEGKPVALPSQTPPSPWSRKAQKPGTQFILSGVGLAFFGLQVLPGFFAGSQLIPGDFQSLVSILAIPVVSVAVAIWFIIAGIRKNKAFKSKLD